MNDEELDPALRHELAALHGEPEAPLGDDALARVIAAAQYESVRLARTRRVRRLAWGTGGVLAAAAGVVLAFVATHRQERAAVAPVVQEECALPFGAAAPAFTSTPDGRQVLSLGVLGDLFAESSAALRVERASACELSIRLAHGALAGDLSNLRPAVLRIQTELGEVVVRGTRFSVAADGGLEVVLLSGVVDVQATDHSLVHLSPGKTLRKSSASAAMQVGAALPEHQRKVEALLTGAVLRAAPPPPSAPDAGPAASRSGSKSNKSTAELLSAAEGERRRGRLPEARALYREAGARRDDNAQVALLRWVLLEVGAGDPAAAYAVLTQYQRRFPDGRLGVEAAWLEVRALSGLGKRSEARAAAERLTARFPATPQAKAARQLLDGR